MAWRQGAAYAQDLRDRVFTAFDSAVPVGRIAGMLFSKFKAILRAMATRTVETLWAALGQSADMVAPTECRNVIAHAGDRQSA